MLEFFAKIIPFDDHVEMVQKALNEYKENLSRETKKRLANYCMLLGACDSMEDMSLEEIQDRRKKFEQLRNEDGGIS